ncbi:uncharacterized protein LOC133717402 [Rosa rugosa]|uniref:uncharacterized protein LOC133717402 n=1 Tax=Rosa rugosa TaxID=74645 RepID=UPI002B40ECBA|nr:uncharacterized protein LOC133717402 [Rosa rugosa]
MDQIIESEWETVNRSRNRKRNRSWSPNPNVKRNRNRKRNRSWSPNPSSNRNRKLYICCQEENESRGCYVIRAIDLERLMACSCDFVEDKCVENKCASCESCPDHDLRPVGLLCGDQYDVPDCMGCCPFGSQVVFVGGELAPWSYDFKPSRKVFVYDIEDGLRLQGLENGNNIKELDKSCNGLANIHHDIYYPRMMEIGGDLYALGVVKCDVSVSQVYRRQLQRWEALPPPIPSFSHDFTSETLYSLLYTDNNIFLSTYFPDMPVKCFDTDRKCWIADSGFNSEVFPFGGEALVVDLDKPSKEKLVFAYGRDTIHVWRLGLTDDLKGSCLTTYGSVNVKPRLHGLLGNLFEVSKQHRLIDLGDGKICLVRARSYPVVERTINSEGLEKVCVVIIVFKYEFDPRAQTLPYKFLSTRTFTFMPHCKESCFVRLLKCFVR